MKRIILLALIGLLPLGASATILSFDGVTGQTEAATNGSETDSCNGNDICAQSLVFENIGGSGIDATVTSNTAADSTGVALWDWYDIGPSNFGGMGAAPEDRADSSRQTFDSGEDNAINEFIIVAFSQAVSLDAFWMNGGLNTNGHASYNGIGDLYLNGAFAEAVGCSASYCDNANLFGTTFAFMAPQDTPFYLAGIDFRVVQVPEPAMGLLLGLGIAGIVIARRRRAV